MSRWSKFLLAARALPKVRFKRIALIAMLLIFAIIVLSLLRQKSMMVDDGVHIPSGYSYVITNDFRLNQEHPPFIKILSGLGLFRVRPELPLNSEGWQKAEQPGDPEDGPRVVPVRNRREPGRADCEGHGLAVERGIDDSGRPRAVVR